MVVAYQRLLLKSAPIGWSPAVAFALGVAFAAVVSACTARAADTSECPGACPAPVPAPPEAALSRAVHLAWSDPHRDLARRYEIERRSGASVAWAGVARVASDQPVHYDDSGPAGRGLALGEYEYRLRGLYRVGLRETWSEWSPAVAVTVREACADSGGELTGLPRVVARDLDGDRRYTGADLASALRTCAGLGGCVLEVLPVTYDDVAIVISDGDAPACDAARTACLTDRFPNGLAIEGHGRSTVLRSPLWKSPSPYLPVPVLELWRRPDVRLQLRHLVLDGRKTEQRDPLPGQNNAVAWEHYGLRVWNRWSDHDKPNRNGCVHDVTVRDFMSRGISLADVARWSVEYSSIEGIGCVRSLTPCPRITVPDAFGPGYTSPGLGIHVDWHSDDVVIRANQVRRATKYSISLKHGQDGAEASIRRPRVEDNDIDEAGGLGIFVAGVANGRFERNRIARTDSLNPQPEARTFNNTFGISCRGAAEGNRFLRNRIEAMEGMAISWDCAGRGNTIEQTRISGSCRRKGPDHCAPGAPQHCYSEPDIMIGPMSSGSLALIDDVVTDSGCAAPLAAAVDKPGFELLIRGGRYAAGPKSIHPIRLGSVDVVLEGGATFVATSLAFGPGTRGLVAPTVSVTGTRNPFRSDPRAHVVICSDRHSDCESICAAPDPPSWCHALESSR